MTIQSIKGGAMIPFPLFSGTPTFTAQTAMTASGHKSAFVFLAPKTGSITRIGIRIDTVTTATDTDFRLETLDLATGQPTGTLVNAGANVTVLAASITANTWVWATLGTAGSVTKDVGYCIVLAPTGTPNYSVSRDIGELLRERFPYGAFYNAVSWSKTLATVFGIEYASAEKQYVVGATPLSALTQISVDGTPDRAGLRFRLPFPSRFAGFYVLADLDQNTSFILYGSDGVTALWTSPGALGDPDLRAATTLGSFYYRLPDADKVSLSANTWYRLATVRSGTGHVLQTMDVDAAATLDLWPMGQDFHYTQADIVPTQESDWTQTTTRSPFISLLLDGFDDATGGAAAVHPVYG